MRIKRKNWKIQKKKSAEDELKKKQDEEMKQLLLLQKKLDLEKKALEETKQKRENESKKKEEEDRLKKLEEKLKEEEDGASENDILMPSMPVAQWGYNEVKQWIQSLKLSKDYGNIVTENGIDSEVLSEFKTKEDWQELGIKAVGDIRKLVKAQNELFPSKK